MMARISVPTDAFKGCFRDWRLWLIQFLANLALFGLFTLWLLIPVANVWHIVLNVLVALLILISALVLHGGTLNYFSSQNRVESIDLLEIFRNAARNLPAVFISATISGLLWFLAGTADKYEENLPNYLRSITPLFLRNLAPLSAYETLVDAGLFTLQWIIAPGLLLPLLASTASHGFGGFARRGIASWKNCVANFYYWAVISVAAVLGIYATAKIMSWTPDFRTSTLPHETASLILRGVISYLLALFAWMLAYSMAGRQSGTTADADDDVAGQTAA
jgi:hypothetical protein